MSEKVKVAVVGYGGMGTWHTMLIQAIDEVELVGVYDILEERNEAARKSGLHAFDTFEELLADDSIEVVTVATPNDTHIDIALKAMEAGKNVISEKPVCLSSKELEILQAAAKKHNVLFTVHQNRRWDEDFLVVKKLYDENTLGNIFKIESKVHGSRGIPSDWRNQKKHGGGMVLDWGVHLFDQVFQMMKDRKLISLYSTLSNVTNEEVDDGFTVTFKFEDNLIFIVEVGTSNFINLSRWYVLGENGSAIIEDWGITGEIVMVSDWEKRDAVPVVTAAGLTKTMAPRTSDTIQKYPLPRVETDIKGFYKNIHDHLRDGKEIIVKPEEMMLGMKIMEAVFESGEENKVIFFD